MVDFEMYRRFSALTFCWFLGMVLLLGLRHHCGISVSSDWETGNGINILRYTPVSEIHTISAYVTVVISATAEAIM